METENKIKALAAFLDEYADTISETRHDDCCFEVGTREYLVCTDDEADVKAEEYIRESLWAFRPSFLASETDLPEEVFKALGEKCEDGNPGVLKMVEKTCGLKSFVESAVSADGRGHFLSSYDNEENETTIDGETLYIYRVN